MKAEQLKLYTSSREYILCLVMRKCLSDKWLQTGVSQGQQHTEQLRETEKKEKERERDCDVTYG